MLAPAAVLFPTLFLLFYVGHLAADYGAQTDRQASRKAGWTDDHGCYHHGWGPALVHAGTHVVTCAVALALGVVLLDLAVPVVPAVLALLWIGGTHLAIDRRRPVQWWMEHTGSTDWHTRGGAAHVDQTAHVLALTVAALALAALA
ncbi:DUF3307 domain-containing protein (plasmid) [Streptomyces sp. BI20]|uniref:DUF3307 domain-containing protein n=1 Tax=Streptomyces sp. BI20 TaxID=3403460 RepID=UPI003C788F72